MDHAENRKKVYDSVLKDIGDVKTWGDFYAAMHCRYAQFLKCRCEMHAVSALCIFYAFILALEEMPEEGDIGKIVEKIAHIMAYDGLARMGIDFGVIDEEEARRVGATAQLANRLLGGNVIAAILHETPEPGDTPAEAKNEVTPSKKLH